MKVYNLYLFDLDGTLADMNSPVMYPDAQAWFDQYPTANWMVCTNQGGVGLRHWMETNSFGEPDQYPTEDAIWERFRALFPADKLDRILVAYAYQSKKSGQWSPTPYDARLDFSWEKAWRKPSPGMLTYAIQLNHIAAGDTVMVGDSDEDEMAADAAGCDFIRAWKFFGRERPDTAP